MLSNVKGLAAVKVTSLIDAFNKPFVVGGLRRPESETDKSQSQASAATAIRVDEPEDDEGPIASPEWPDEADEPDEPLEMRGRGRTPSRSPGVSPEPRGGGEDDDGEELAGTGAWQDPLEEAEEEEAPVAKKARVEV